MGIGNAWDGWRYSFHELLNRNFVPIHMPSVPIVRFLKVGQRFDDFIEEFD
jgi:hypothetical protein